MSGTGGQFADGFSLGIIGIALSLAATPLGLSSGWMGALGAASLAGLFLGSLVAGPISDRIGRRPIFAWDMLVFTGIAVAQFYVSSPEQLLFLRLLLGVALGADYVVSKSLVTEFAPIRTRGRLLSVLAVAWAAGYVCSYCAGYLIRDMGPSAWRWALLSSGVPSLVIFALRVQIPESPHYLVAKGKVAEARAIIDRALGRDVELPHIWKPVATDEPVTGLFSRKLWKNLVTGCVFYTCQVIPFFAIGTYLPTILGKLGVTDSYSAGLIFNLLLMLGAVLGLIVVDRIPRRTFLTGSFALMAGLLAILLNVPVGMTAVTIGLFAAFAFILAASVNLEFVYPPELFPTAVRATGIGVVVACSRLGSAFSTFVLPVVVEDHGIAYALTACVGVLIFGAVVCQLWAPETRNAEL
nr:MFS transporter [Sphingobium sp. JAI105]